MSGKDSSSEIGERIERETEAASVYLTKRLKDNKIELDPSHKEILQQLSRAIAYTNVSTTDLINHERVATPKMKLGNPGDEITDYHILAMNNYKVDIVDHARASFMKIAISIKSKPGAIKMFQEALDDTTVEHRAESTIKCSWNLLDKDYEALRNMHKASVINQPVQMEYLKEWVLQTRGAAYSKSTKSLAEEDPIKYRKEHEEDFRNYSDILEWKLLAASNPRRFHKKYEEQLRKVDKEKRKLGIHSIVAVEQKAREDMTDENYTPASPYHDRTLKFKVDETSTEKNDPPGTIIIENSETNKSEYVIAAYKGQILVFEDGTKRDALKQIIFEGEYFSSLDDNLKKLIDSPETREIPFSVKEMEALQTNTAIPLEHKDIIDIAINSKIARDFPVHEDIHEFVRDSIIPIEVANAGAGTPTILSSPQKQKPKAILKKSTPTTTIATIDVELAAESTSSSPTRSSPSSRSAIVAGNIVKSLTIASSSPKSASGTAHPTDTPQVAANSSVAKPGSQIG